MKLFNLFFTDRHENQIINVGKADYSFLGGDKEHVKCLPLKIAGELGWDLILPNDYTINWTGGDAPQDIKIYSEDKSDFVSSSLGFGIITFKIPYVFELEKNTFLWIKGPSNNPLSLDLYAMEGTVECDWFPSHITMNYKIINKNKDIVLKKNKAYCRLLPYPKKYIETFKPKYCSMQNHKDFVMKYSTYNFFNRFMPFSKGYMTSYIRGLLGEEQMDNIPKIKLSSPNLETSNGESKCPFLKLFKK